MHTADATTWIQLIGLGCLLGAVGQVVRAIVGLKKLNDAASRSQVSTRSLIDPSRLFTSILIGGAAGALASIGLSADVHAIGSPQIMALLGAGYAGADFIEGFMSRATAAPETPAGTAAVGTAPAPPVPASSSDAVG